MDITIKIEAPALVDAINALAVAFVGNIELLLDGPGARAATKPITEAPKIVTEPTDTVNEQQENDSNGTVIYTLEQVRAKFVSKNSTKNRDTLKKLLGDFNVKKVTELQEKDFAAVMARLEKI